MLCGLTKKVDRLSHLESTVTTMKQELSIINTELTTVRIQISEELIGLQKDVWDTKNDHVILEERLRDLERIGTQTTEEELVPGFHNAQAVAIVELSRKAHASEILLTNWPKKNQADREDLVAKMMKQDGMKLKPKFVFHGDKICRLEFPTATDTQKFKNMWKAKKPQQASTPIYAAVCHLKSVTSLTRPLLQKNKELRDAGVSCHVDWRDLTLRNDDGEGLYMLMNGGRIVSLGSPRTMMED